jgi:hypothetical protein
MAATFSRLDHLTEGLTDPGKTQADKIGLKAGCGTVGFRREEAEKGLRQYHCRTRFQIFSAAPGVDKGFPPGLLRYANVYTCLTECEKVCEK